MKNLRSGDIVQGRVFKIYKTHVLVELASAQSAILHVSEVSDYYVSSLSYIFKLGIQYYFYVNKVVPLEKRIELSWKKIMPRYLKNPFEYNVKETKGRFVKLRAFITKRTEKW